MAFRLMAWLGVGLVVAVEENVAMMQVTASIRDEVGIEGGTDASEGAIDFDDAETLVVDTKAEKAKSSVNLNTVWCGSHGQTYCQHKFFSGSTYGKRCGLSRSGRKKVRALDPWSYPVNKASYEAKCQACSSPGTWSTWNDIAHLSWIHCTVPYAENLAQVAASIDGEVGAAATKRYCKDSCEEVAGNCVLSTELEGRWKRNHDKRWAESQIEGGHMKCRSCKRCPAQKLAQVAASINGEFGAAATGRYCKDYCEKVDGNCVFKAKFDKKFSKSIMRQALYRRRCKKCKKC